MRSTKRILSVGTATAMAALLAACGSSSGGGGTTSAKPVTGAASGTLRVAMGTAPDSLDPQYGYTTQAAEADWITYTPLLTYKHDNGTDGTELIPGLATALPTVSANGLTYKLTLRKGLTYSNGVPVKASDFAYTIQRAIKINWGGDSFFTQYIAGANAFASGKATSISGIVTDDATGAITINLVSAYGAFSNVLAFPAAALVPTGTALKPLSNDPPVGVGAYVISHVTPNVSFTLTQNPKFAAFKIPNIPTGGVKTVNVTIESNNTTEAQDVLDNTQDVFDPGDTLPSAVLPQIESQAADRYSQISQAQMFYFFLNTTNAPFNNPIAREAVNMAVDRTALAKLSSGFVKPGCYFLPPTIVGHPTSACPYGDPSTSPSAATIAKAKAMVTAAGLAGTPVTVWSETRSPRQQYCIYYESVLNEIGFKASLKVIADSVYFQTIGSAQTDPQTGFADWSQDFPNPSDFYLLLSKAAIQPVNNENFGDVDDPHIESELTKLNAVPATKLKTVSAEWTALDEYVAKKAYSVVFGYQTSPAFYSTRVVKGSEVFNPVYFTDWSSIRVS